VTGLEFLTRGNTGEECLPVFLKGDRKHVLSGESIDVEEQLMKIFPRKRVIAIE